MPKPKPDFTWEEMERIRDRHGFTRGVPPPNSFSRADYATRYGLTRQTAGDHLARLVKAGELERCTVVVDGHPAVRFWPKPKKPRSRT